MKKPTTSFFRIRQALNTARLHRSMAVLHPDTLEFLLNNSQQHAEEISRLQREVRVRSHPPAPWQVLPDGFKGPRNAYACGFETAWRGDPFREVYKRLHEHEAEWNGYQAGLLAVQKAL